MASRNTWRTEAVVESVQTHENVLRICIQQRLLCGGRLEHREEDLVGLRQMRKAREDAPRDSRPDIKNILVTI